MSSRPGSSSGGGEHQRPGAGASGASLQGPPADRQETGQHPRPAGATATSGHFPLLSDRNTVSTDSDDYTKQSSTAHKLHQNMEETFLFFFFNVPMLLFAGTQTRLAHRSAVFGRPNIEEPVFLLLIVTC